MAVPDEQLARQLVVQLLGVQPLEVRRFLTGAMHYVYEATFEGHPPVVVRIAASYGHAAMRGAAQLSRLLRPRGVPLPAILAENLDGPFPCLILERLPGTDLGDVVGNLSKDQAEAVATAVVASQRIVAGLPVAAGKYGYAVSCETAPHTSWSQVLSSHFERSRKHIAAAGIYDVEEVEPLFAVLADMDDEINSVAPTPFLHDTTTKNVIVTAEGKFSGIVDVDDLCFGDPRFAVALTSVALLAWSLPLDYTAAWIRIAGFAEDRLFRVYLALFLADFMSERGMQFNRDKADINPEYDQRLRQLYREAFAQLSSPAQ